MGYDGAGGDDDDRSDYDCRSDDNRRTDHDLAVSTAEDPRKMSESNCSNFVLRRAVRVRKHGQPVAVGSAALLPGQAVRQTPLHPLINIAFPKTQRSTH